LDGVRTSNLISLFGITNVPGERLVKISKRSTVFFVLIVLLLTASIIVSFGTVPALRTTIPGRIVRWFLGEPTATQDVNDAADKLIANGWDKELISLSDQLMTEYATVTTLPEAPFGGHLDDARLDDARLIPIDRLPEKYHELGGTFGPPHN
jgi:hypothetical protein